MVVGGTGGRGTRKLVGESDSSVRSKKGSGTGGGGGGGNSLFPGARGVCSIAVTIAVFCTIPASPGGTGGLAWGVAELVCWLVGVLGLGFFSLFFFGGFQYDGISWPMVSASPLCLFVSLLKEMMDSFWGQVVM